MQALEYLFRKGTHVNAQRPDLILLDLDLPKRSMHEVVAEIKKDLNLRHIPVVIFTSSAAPIDISAAYALQANCYVNLNRRDYRNSYEYSID